MALLKKSVEQKGGKAGARSRKRAPARARKRASGSGRRTA
jgi:hypothetical protein